MTTEAAAMAYEYQHLKEMIGRGYAVYNPHNKPVEELPVIYGFNNGGNSIFLSAVAMAEDGTELGGHACSSESYMRHDLGILEGTRKDRHENDYQKHYPDGYRMDFVSYDDVENHPSLMKAIELAKAKAPEAQSTDA